MEEEDNIASKRRRLEPQQQDDAEMTVGYSVGKVPSGESGHCLAVPENACSMSDKEDAARHGVTIAEAKKQPGFDDPIDWLYFNTPKDLTTDIVVGVGRRLGQIAQIFKELHQCKSVYVVPNPYEDGILERKHLKARMAANRSLGQSLERNVGLRVSEMADLTVTTEPKTSEELSRQYHEKEIFQLTPGILREFSDVKQATADRTKFRILIFADGNPENFEQEGLDITAKAVADLEDRSYQLLFVGTVEGKEKQLKEEFLKYGVAKSQLKFRGLPKSEEELKRLFCEADLAIMPSSEQGFQMVTLAALSSGLPILVHGDSGFGEALTPVPGGTSSTVDSDDAKVWAKAIKKVRVTDRKIRLKEADMLRSSYDEKYSWEKQCGDLVKIMMGMASEAQQDLNT